ncbi:Stealth CR1 domain-containing protein [Streptococcus suis]|uniref:Stealth CR1 domain-containing protein n=1 Tax=Streptococcus suis TaxID=1307 RepID=UPI0018651751|nr:Stealth CR1 domain-containing protein [Streptococcus suis]
MDKIDVVVMWVDGTDPVWLAEKKAYSPDGSFDEADNIQRYRPSDLFRYWFRGIEKNAPWVNKIFFITYGHVPEWLNVEHSKIRIVRHKDFMPREYLPVYNSSVIELNIHRIEELSEQFILFNDDIYLIGKTRQEDFFVDGKVKDFGIYKPIIPKESFNHNELNNTWLINKNFPNHKKRILKSFTKFFRIDYGMFNINNFFALFYNGIFGYKSFHVTVPHLKSTYEEVWKSEGVYLDKISHNRFRTIEDVTNWLMSHWNIESGRFVPQKINFGHYFSAESEAEIVEAMLKNKYKVICINDENNNHDYEESAAKVRLAFEEKFPEKSSFEK